MINRLKFYLKPYIERLPTLALSYRAVRDVAVFQRQKPQKTPHGFLLMGNRQMETGEFEPEETALVKEYLADMDVFVDIGANIGFYTCLAKFLGKQVVAIEPLHQNLRYLYGNLMANGWDDVEVYPVGLSNHLGLAPLYGGSTGASLMPGWAGVSELWRQTIALVTLDCILGKRFEGKKLLVKIDVEGTEYAVLEGASRTLSRFPCPLWLVEICLSEHHPKGYNPFYKRTFEMFWKHGYEARIANQAGGSVSPKDVTHWLSTKTCSSHNYVFMPKESWV